MDINIKYLTVAAELLILFYFLEQFWGRLMSRKEGLKQGEIERKHQEINYINNIKQEIKSSQNYSEEFYKLKAKEEECTEIIVLILKELSNRNKLLFENRSLDILSSDSREIYSKFLKYEDDLERNSLMTYPMIKLQTAFYSQIVLLLLLERKNKNSFFNSDYKLSSLYRKEGSVLTIKESKIDELKELIDFKFFIAGSDNSSKLARILKIIKRENYYIEVDKLISKEDQFNVKGDFKEIKFLPDWEKIEFQVKKENDFSCTILSETKKEPIEQVISKSLNNSITNLSVYIKNEIQKNDEVISNFVDELKCEVFEKRSDLTDLIKEHYSMYSQGEKQLYFLVNNAQDNYPEEFEDYNESFRKLFNYLENLELISEEKVLFENDDYVVFEFDEKKIVFIRIYDLDNEKIEKKVTEIIEIVNDQGLKNNLTYILFYDVEDSEAINDISATILNLGNEKSSISYEDYEYQEFLSNYKGFINNYDLPNLSGIELYLLSPFFINNLITKLENYKNIDLSLFQALTKQEIFNTKISG